MSSSLSKVLETGINVFKSNSRIIQNMRLREGIQLGDFNAFQDRNQR